MSIIEIPYRGENIVLDSFDDIIEKMSDLREEGYSFSKDNFLYALGASNDYLFDDEDDFCWESLISILKTIVPKEKSKIRAFWYDESRPDLFYYDLSCGHQVTSIGYPPKRCCRCGREINGELRR